MAPLWLGPHRYTHITSIIILSITIIISFIITSILIMMFEA